MERQAQYDDDDAGEHGSPKAEHAQSPAVIETTFAVEARDHGASAESEDVAKRNHHGEYRCRDGHAGHHVGVAGVRDEVGVHGVVDEGDHHAQHDGYGQGHVCARNRRLLKQFVIHIRCRGYNPKRDIRQSTRRNRPRSESGIHQGISQSAATWVIRIVRMDLLGNVLWLISSGESSAFQRHAIVE